MIYIWKFGTNIGLVFFKELSEKHVVTWQKNILK